MNHLALLRIFLFSIGGDLIFYNSLSNTSLINITSPVYIEFVYWNDETLKKQISITFNPTSIIELKFNTSVKKLFFPGLLTFLSLFPIYLRGVPESGKSTFAFDTL